MTMQIIRWNPMREVAHMHDEIMRDWLRQGRTGAWAPPMDAIAHESALVLELDLPGVALEDIALEAHEGTLTVRGERRRPAHEGAWQRAERAFGHFTRTLRLPDDAQAEGITAALHQGVLTVRIPRAARPAPHRITVTEAPAEPAVTAPLDAVIESEGGA